MNDKPPVRFDLDGYGEESAWVDEDDQPVCIARRRDVHPRVWQALTAEISAVRAATLDEAVVAIEQAWEAAPNGGAGVLAASYGFDKARQVVAALRGTT